MQEKLLRVTEKTIIVRVDIAKKEHWARITAHRGVDLCKPIKVLNNEENFNKLMVRVEVLRQKYGCEQVMVGIEPPGHYWKSVWLVLVSSSKQPRVAGVNPYHTKQAKELDDNSQTKSDKKDALTIAHLVRDGRYFDIYLPESAYAELRILTNERKRLQKQVSRARNTIIALMDEYFPEYDEIWEDVTCPTSRKVIRNLPFPSDIMETGERNLANTLSIFSSGTEGKVHALQLIEAAGNSIGVVEGRSSTKLRLCNLLDELEVYE